MQELARPVSVRGARHNSMSGIWFFLTYQLPQQTPWTTAEVRELIYREFGIEYSPNQVIRILRQRVGMPFNKPFPRDYRRPSDAEERLKASLHLALILLNRKGIPKDALALGFRDEASPQNRAHTVRVGCGFNLMLSG